MNENEFELGGVAYVAIKAPWRNGIYPACRGCVGESDTGLCGKLPDCFSLNGVIFVEKRP